MKSSIQQECETGLREKKSKSKYCILKLDNKLPAATFAKTTRYGTTTGII